MTVPVQVTATSLVDYLGRPRFTPESAERTAVPGVATGLAVTGAGGDVLFVEATAMPGDAGLTLTGQLGDVMKESAQIALSYLRAHGRDLGVDPTELSRALHLHVPAGAVPKDGPSAGVTMVTALASLATGRPVRSDVGMTGEVTLNGRVLPIGGVKQKLLAAHRAGLTTVFLPHATSPTSTTCPRRSARSSTCDWSATSPTSSEMLSSRSGRRPWSREHRLCGTTGRLSPAYRAGRRRGRSGLHCGRDPRVRRAS